MFLVTGSTGFLGRHLQRYCQRQQSTSQFHFLSRATADLTDSARLNECVSSISYEGVIHLAAESRTAACEKSPDLAEQVNVVGTRNLLKAVSRARPWFLYVSTDMVFNGAIGNYCPTDQPEPINFYGKSKLQAEQLVAQSGLASCILRPALIYGEDIDGRVSCLSWALDVIQGNAAGFFYDNEFRTPVFVDDLIALIVHLTQERPTGVVHAGGRERLSRWEYAKHVADVWQYPLVASKCQTLEDTAENRWRPRDLSLDSSWAHGHVPFHTTISALEKIRQRSPG